MMLCPSDAADFANGSIAPVEINARGVGSHDASEPIRAAHYSRLAGGGHKTELAALSPGAEAGTVFVVAGLGDGSTLVFRRVERAHCAGGSATLRMRVASGGVARGAVTVGIGDRRAAPDSFSYSASCALPATSSWGAYVDVDCALPPAAGGDAAREVSLLLRFGGPSAGDEIARIATLRVACGETG